jgi:hypothetical protein
MSHRKQPQGLASTPTTENEALEHPHHNFTIEIFLDEGGEVRDIFIDHGHSKKPEKINGWEPEKLINYIAQHACIKLAKPESEGPISRATTSAKEESIVPSHAQKKSSKPSSELKGTIHLREFKILPVEPQIHPDLLPHDRPFSVRLNLDLTEVALLKDTSLTYETTVIASPIGGSERTAGKTRKKMEASMNAVITVNCVGLVEGIYRMSAIVRLAIADTDKESTGGIVAYLENGDLIEVY